MKMDFKVTRYSSRTWLESVMKIFFALVWALASMVQTNKVPLPDFRDLRQHYPGYRHYGGEYRNHELIQHLQLENTSNLLIHDTSALRLSFTLNHVGNVHSLGTELIRLSKFGHDSVQGKDNMQYIFLPISYGPYLADKYGYPNISKLHLTDPIQTMNSFWAKQGILRVITYTSHGNEPKGHVALWDCNHFHQSKDWIAGNSLLTVEFWESPDSNCPLEDEAAPIKSSAIPDRPVPASQSKGASQSSHQSKLMSLLKDDGNVPSRTNDLKHLILPTNARHSSRKMRNRIKT